MLSKHIKKKGRMIMTPDTFTVLVEDWIASSRKPLAPRTKQNYRATLRSFYDVLHDERLDFDSKACRCGREVG